MASSPPTVLLFGHSFIRRLRDDLQTQFDPRADEGFKLSKDAIVHLHGVGGRIVRKLIQYDKLSKRGKERKRKNITWTPSDKYRSLDGSEKPRCCQQKTFGMGSKTPRRYWLRISAASLKKKRKYKQTAKSSIRKGTTARSKWLLE